MRMISVSGIFAALMAAVLCVSSVWAAQVKRSEVPVVPLTAEGQKLEAKYDEQLKELKAKIQQELPKIDEQKKTDFVKVYQDEANASSVKLKAILAQGGKKVKDKEAAAKAHEEAVKALDNAVNKAQPLAKAILAELDEFLKSDKMDSQLVKLVVLTEATPRGLAEFAQQGKEHEALVEKLLADVALMKQMLIAGGATDGKYGQAMKIYTDIQRASAKAGEGILQKLALGTSLELAVPVQQMNAAADTDAPATVDPVKRYLHFEKAYLAGELDPGFKDLSAWDCRYVVNGNEPDHILAWGREMLRNYRPDHISTSDYRWRYVKAVKTEVKYGSADQKFDRPELQGYQNMIMNGGVCGRRAFFGRFIVRCFGIPTLARPQPGHATLVHWTPEGWVINLGAGWNWGTVAPYGSDNNFLAHTQARMAGESFVEVLRAQWIGTVLGEQKVYGFYAEPSGFWNGVALYRQRAIIEEAEAVALAAVGTDIGEANESKEKEVVETVVLTDDDKRIFVGEDGVITIPAVACSMSTNSPEKILFMESVLGGKQLHYARLGNEPKDFEYTVEVPSAGKYTLSARVVTTSANQILLVAVNGAKEPVSIAVPFTVGMWDKTVPVEIELAKGKNVLTFSRGGENIKGLTIKDFTLAPVK